MDLGSGRRKVISGRGVSHQGRGLGRGSGLRRGRTRVPVCFVILCPRVVLCLAAFEKRGCERCVMAGMHGWLGICWILKKYLKRLSVRRSHRGGMLV